MKKSKNEKPIIDDDDRAAAILAHLRKPETARDRTNKARHIAEAVGLGGGETDMRWLDRMLQTMKRDGAIEYVKGHGWKMVST